jgi:hypothetical protein
MARKKGAIMKKQHKKFRVCPALGCFLLTLFVFAGCPLAEDDPAPNTTEEPGGDKTGKPDAPAIMSFVIEGMEGIIDGEASPKTVTLTLPTGMPREDLVPAITLSEGAVVNPPSGAAQDFTRPVDYTLLREADGAQTIYRVTVRNRAAIIGFKIEAIAGIIEDDADPKTIRVTMPAGTNLSALSPVITLSDPAAVVSPASGTARDFTQPVSYTLDSQDGQTSYQVWVSRAEPDASDARAISSFTINGIPGAIDETAKTIIVMLDFGTDLKALRPAITVSAKAQVSPASGEAQNFANTILIPKKYTVTAENGMQEAYKVTALTNAQSSFILELTTKLELLPKVISLAKGGNAAIAVSATQDYDDYRWQVDGNIVDIDNRTRTITLRAADYFIGVHYLGVTAYQKGIPSYTEQAFTVTP